MALRRAETRFSWGKNGGDLKGRGLSKKNINDNRKSLNWRLIQFAPSGFFSLVWFFFIGFPHASTNYIHQRQARPVVRALG